MTGQIVEIEATDHQKVQKLLPWLANGSLPAGEQALVRAHLRQCPECQDDLAWQREMTALQPAPRTHPDVERGYAALAARLGAAPGRAAPAGALGALGAAAAWPARLRRAFAGWRGWTMAVQGGLIAGLVAALAPHLMAPPGPAAYRGLSAPAPAAAAPGCQVLIAFKPDTTEAQLRRILKASGARLLDGPTVADAYVLALAAPRCEAALAALRREPAVTLVAPIDAGAR